MVACNSYFISVVATKHTRRSVEVRLSRETATYPTSSNDDIPFGKTKNKNREQTETLQY